MLLGTNPLYTFDFLMGRNSMHGSLSFFSAAIDNKVLLYQHTVNGISKNEAPNGLQ